MGQIFFCGPKPTSTVENEAKRTKSNWAKVYQYRGQSRTRPRLVRRMCGAPGAPPHTCFMPHKRAHSAKTTTGTCFLAGTAASSHDSNVGKLCEQLLHPTMCSDGGSIHAHPAPSPSPCTPRHAAPQRNMREHCVPFWTSCENKLKDCAKKSDRKALPAQVHTHQRLRWVTQGTCATSSLVSSASASGQTTKSSMK